MKISIISSVFPPEPIVSAQTSSSLAEELVKIGYQVYVFTAFPNRPGGELYSGYKRKLFQREFSRRGFELIRCFSFLSKQSSMFSRYLENISFGITSSFQLFFHTKPDVIYSNTWPIFASGMISFVAKIRRIPLVISVQDVYPESLIAQKRVIKESIFYKMMLWIDNVIARSAKALIIISPRFANFYINQRMIPEKKVHYIPNWVDENRVEMVSGSLLRKNLNISINSFVVVYGGNIGMAAGVETVIEAFKYLQQENIYLVVAGDGSRVPSCKILAKEVENKNILFQVPWPVEQTSETLRAADLLILPTISNQSEASVPSKLISYMLSGRPVLALALNDTEIAKIIQESGCGWVIKPDDPQSLAKKIIEISGYSRGELKQKGLSGREYALAYFTSKVCLPKVVDILEEVANEV